MQGSDKSPAELKPLLEGSAATVSHIYKLSRTQLQQLFSGHGNMTTLNKKEYGSTKGVIKKLASDANAGIIGDEKDLARRQAVFGANIKPLPQTPGLIESIKQTCQDKVWLVVGASALLSAVCSGFAVGLGGLVEGVSIIIAAIILIAITSVADWIKDKRFVSLQALIKEETIAVIRGKFGATQSVSVWDLVVGDVVLLETGANIPCDCLVLEAHDLKVTQTNEAGVEGSQNKRPVVDEFDVNSDPFLKMGSNIIQGQCKALVCVVGDKATGFKEQEQLATDEDTKLQIKLKNLSDQFTLYGIYAAAAIFALFLVRLILELAAIDPNAPDAAEKPGVAGVLVSKLTGHINLIVVLVVVSIPEGLPLTIGVSLAFTVMRMYSEKILVRKLDAPEKMGSVKEVLINKTGTITRNEMYVHQFYCESKFVKNTRNDTLLNCELSEDAITRIQESILYNCEARIEMDTTTYVPVGNGTEVGLLRFLQDADIPVHLLIQKKLGQIRMISPFSSEKKRSIVALNSPDRQGRVCVYMKGAPEMIIQYCGAMMAGQSRIADIDQKDILDNISRMASYPLRVMGLAYIEMDEAEWTQYEQSGNAADNFEKALDTSRVSFTWIGAFGLQDKIRKNVRECVKYARDQGDLSLRLISGDHVETAKQVAIKAGILRPEESGRNYAVMTGKDFRSHVGALTQKRGDDMGSDVELVPEHPQAFAEIANHIRVLARATPQDRLILVAGLKQLGKTVAVHGSGINDAEALRHADVGIAMGNGCSTAKEAADIIIINNDFQASLRSVMWGRNIYHNVSRFLQFQVTVNISALATVFIGGAIFGESPLSAVQLLWINLIMDTFAAIALSTEPPLASVLQGVPFKSNAPLLSETVWRQIIGVSVWNTIVMVFLILFGSLIGGLDYKYSTPTEITSGPLADEAMQKRQHFTYIFNTFIFLQLFNEINCRKVGRRDFNVFEKFLHNWYFLGVLLGTFAAQILMCKFFPTITGTEQMSKGEWGACIAVGSTNLLIGAILKLCPDSWMKKLENSNIIDEDRAIDNKILQAWNKQDAGFADNNSDRAINYDNVGEGSAADDGDFQKI